MRNTLTLIGPSSATALKEEVIAAARAALVERGGQVGEPDWLAPDIACDLPFEGCDPAAAEAAVRARLAGAALDLAAQPAEGRRKRLLVADMESTIITREMLDELGRLAGRGDRIAAITARSMRGEIDFAQSVRERVALLAGLPVEVLDGARDLIELTPGARTLVQTMRAHGAYSALVSGGFDCFTAVAHAACGFDEHRANRLVIEDGRITGRVAEPILDRRAKLEALEQLAAARGLPLATAAAVGDGANDIPMLQAAGLGVAFRGKPAVAATTRFRLDHADLTGLLYLQGYRAAEFQH
jgi:phosphoserine phosphatase